MASVNARVLGAVWPPSLAPRRCSRNHRIIGVSIFVSMGKENERVHLRQMKGCLSCSCKRSCVCVTLRLSVAFFRLNQKRIYYHWWSHGLKVTWHLAYTWCTHGVHMVHPMMLRCFHCDAVSTPLPVPCVDSVVYLVYHFRRDCCQWGELCEEMHRCREKPRWPLGETDLHQLQGLLRHPWGLGQTGRSPVYCLFYRVCVYLYTAPDSLFM